MLSTLKKYEVEDEAHKKMLRESIQKARLETLAENEKAIAHRK